MRDNSYKFRLDSLFIYPQDASTGNFKVPFTHKCLLTRPRDLILTHKEARAGSPEDIAVCGEEDVGSGLEFLVNRNDKLN